MTSNVVFAPLGNGENFFKKYTSSLEAPIYMKEMELNGYEYSCFEGIHISDDAKEILKKEAVDNNILLSVFASDNLLESCDLAYKIGANRVSFTLGNCDSISRSTVFSKTLRNMQDALKNSKGEIYLCPQIMGKIQDFGSFSEVIKLCSYDDMFLPAINIGNLNGRTLGLLNDEFDYEKLILEIISKVGIDKAKIMHMYFSKVVYTNQGFKECTSFSDSRFQYPKYERLLDAIYKYNLTPFIVCNSRRTQDIDAVKMKKYFLKKGEI